MSVAEGKQLGSGKSERDLKLEADEAEHDRDQRFKSHFEDIALVILYLVAGALITSGVIWFYHLIGPDTWPKLREEQLDDIQSFLTGGLILGLLADHYRKRMR